MLFLRSGVVPRCVPHFQDPCCSFPQTISHVMPSCPTCGSSIGGGSTTNFVRLPWPSLLCLLAQYGVQGCNEEDPCEVKDW